MSSEDRKAELESWRDTVNANGYYGAITAMANASASTSSYIDKVSTWAAGGTAAIAGLAIANIDKMTAIFSVNEFKKLIIIACVSFGFALLQKYFHILCELSLKVQSEIISQLDPVFKKYDSGEAAIEKASIAEKLDVKASLDMSKVIADYFAFYPWPLEKLILKANSNSDSRIRSAKKLVRSYIYQIYSISLQYLCIFGFLVYGAFVI